MNVFLKGFTIEIKVQNIECIYRYRYNKVRQTDFAVLYMEL